MRNARRPLRASHRPAKPGAAQRFAACLQLLEAGTTHTPEQAAAVLRELAQAPYRKPPQGELPLAPAE